MALKNLLVKVGVSTKGLNANLRRTKNTFRREFGEIQSLTANVGRSMKSALTVPLLGIGAAAVKSAADLEKMETSFISLTGGAKQAADMMANLNEFTAKTPFQIEGVANAARQLIASGTEVTQVNDQLQFLGDIAATSGVSIEEIAAIFAKVNAKGKVELENLNQLAERGIPIFKALADATGLPADALGAGAVSVEEFNRTLSGFAKEGGFAAGAMERLSETAAGKFSTALDNLKLAGADLVQDLMPVLKDILDKIVQLAQRFRDLSPETKELVLQIGALVAVLGPALMAFSAMMPAITVLLGPVGLLVAAIATAVGGFVSLARKIDKARNRERDMRLELERVEQQYRNNIKAIQDYHKSVDKTATIEDKLADMTLPNVEAALGRVNGQVKGMAMHMKTAIGQKDLDRIKELEESYKGVELFGLTPLEAAIADYRAELKKAKEDQDKAGAGVGLGDGDDMTVSVPRQADMVELTNKQATAIENVGAAATATLQPMTDWTQTVADEQNLEAGQRFNEMLYNMKDAALELAQTIGAQLGGAFAAMITGAKKSGEAFKGFAKEAIKAALAASQAHIIEAAISSGKMSGPLAMFVIPGLIAAGMGIVDAAFGDVAAFAAGGLVTGPVLGLVGEGPGTSRMNPEVIAPLDKLQSMMGGSQVQVTGMLRGADILLTNERAQIDRNRLRSF